MKTDQMTMSLIWNMVRMLTASVLAAELGTQLDAAWPPARSSTAIC